MHYARINTLTKFLLSLLIFLTGSIINSQGQTIIPVQIHLVRQSGVMADSVLIRNEIAAASLFFQGADIAFQTCNPVHIIDTNVPLSDNQVANLSNNPRQIDIYFKATLQTQDVCGYASISWGSDQITFIGGNRIFIANACINRYTIAHELGHYLHLNHTHDSTIPELADGSNCATAGDGFCDTPADPNLKGLVNTSCVYTGTATDANGDPYNPDVQNIMSYGRNECLTRFSTEQLASMKAFYENEMADLYGCDSRINMYLVSSFFFPLNSLNRDYVRNQTIAIQNNTSKSYNGNVNFRASYQDPSNLNWIVFASQVFNSYWSAFDTDSFTVGLQAPAAMLDGNYVVKFEIDYTNSIDEALETDNDDILTIAVTGDVPAQVDFEVSAQMDGVAYRGFPIDVKYQVKNVGSANSPQTSMGVKIILSSDSIKSSEDLDFTLFYSGANFAMNVVNEKKEKLPLFDKVGIQYLIIEISSNYTEITKANNKVIIPIQVIDIDHENLLDYAITNLTVTNSPVSVQDAITGNFTLQNLNTSATYNFGSMYLLPTGFYISTDNQLSSNDVFIGTNLVTFLPGASHSASNSLTQVINQSVPSGNYYLLVTADHYNMIREKDETNNMKAVPITISNGTDADLVVSGIRTNKTHYLPGESISYEVDITNQGYASIDKYYLLVDLKTNSFYNSHSDFLSAASHDTPMAPGEKVTFTWTTIIDAALPHGIYYVTPSISILFGTVEFTTNNKIFPSVPVVIGNPVTSVSNKTIAEASIYPIPANDELHVIADLKITTLQIFTLNGQDVSDGISYTSSGNNTIVDVSSLNNGFYYLKLSNEKQVINKKIMINKK